MKENERNIWKKERNMKEIYERKKMKEIYERKREIWKKYMKERKWKKYMKEKENERNIWNMKEIYVKKERNICNKQLIVGGTVSLGAKNMT